MIPLLGQSSFAGAWPELGPSVLLQVQDRDGNRLSLDCFHGAPGTDLIDGTIGEAQLGHNGPPNLVISPALAHLGPGDIIAVHPRNGRTRVLYRKESVHNSFLVTERCDNYCLMCSQPPRNVQDGYLIDEILASISRLPKDLREIGFTGGEPTLTGDRFIEVLAACKEELPATAVHVLSNGRSFANREYAKKWAGVDHPDLMTGIPVYSDQSHIHDFVVQADGAFDETIRGILNLKSLGQSVEIRIVLHRHTIGRLAKFAEFVARNLTFVDHVALMGLEVMGFAIAHQEDLWIRLGDHSEVIAEAAGLLAAAGLRPSIYNVPLCLLAPSARRYAIASISDWKREYWRACEPCSLRVECGGAFFSSRSRLEPEIRPEP